MSARRNARKKDDQNGIKKLTGKSGRGKSGKMPVITSSPEIQPAVRAEILAKCCIMPILIYTARPNTSIYPILKPSVYPAITVHITVASDASSARKLDRNKKVNAAIDALVRRIRNELYFSENTGTGDGMNGTGTSTGELRRE